MKVVDGDKTGIWDGVARIIGYNEGLTIYKTANGDETDTFLSLNDCLKLVNYEITCVVILDDYRSGKVYQFGNFYDGKWYEYGETEGYA